jgi:diguanylate cyclase (GGDEF)-like protein
MSEAETNLPLWLAFLALSEQATRDGLTGLYNRRYFEETLADHIAAASRYERDLSLVLIDLDDFKRINDSAGHPAGDVALRQFADRLKSSARKADIVCRYGGDEFAVILPETSRNDAMKFLQRLHDAGAMSSSTADSGDAIPPVFSFTSGIAALPCDDLVGTADADLLARKKESRR